MCSSIAIVAVSRQHFYRDTGDVFHPFDVQIKAGIVLAPHRVSNKLRPEFGIAFPIQPVHGPAILYVGSKYDRLSQSKLPPRQERPVLEGFQQDFSHGPWFYLDVALEPRRGTPVDSLKGLDILGQAAV
jgi:hypothetical protein